MVAEGSHTVRSEETTKPGPPCATEDTEEGRRNRTKAWITEAAAQDMGWEDDGELEVMHQDHDVRLREPERVDSRVPPVSQRERVMRAPRHEGSNEVQDRDPGKDQKWLN